LQQRYAALVDVAVVLVLKCHVTCPTCLPQLQRSAACVWVVTVGGPVGAARKWPLQSSVLVTVGGPVGATRKWPLQSAVLVTLGGGPADAARTWPLQSSVLVTVGGPVGAARK
jgi:hypothetical protein